MAQPQYLLIVAWREAVSSVTPSPLAPLALTDWNSAGQKHETNQLCARYEYRAPVLTRNSVVVVLVSGTTEDLAAGSQTSRLGGGSKSLLDVGAGAGTSALVTLEPLGDGRGAGGTSEEGASGATVNDGLGDVAEGDVLEENGAGEERGLGGGGLEEDRSVGDGNIEDGLGADGLAGRVLLRSTGGDGETNTAV